MSTPAHEHDLVPVEEVVSTDPDRKLWPVVMVVGHRCCITPCTYFEPAEVSR